MTKFVDLVGLFKINKLFKDKASTTKETKEKLNEITTLVISYALTVLSETCKDKQTIDENDIKKVFRSLNKGENKSNL